MRNFSSKRKANSRLSFRHGALRALLLVAASLLLLFFAARALGALSASVTSPLYGLRSWISAGISAVPSYISDRNHLHERILELEDEVASKNNNEANIAHLAAENADLREHLRAKPDAKRIAAGVIARPPALPYDAVLLDRGSRGGIVEGAVVYRSPNTAIGVVSRVYAESALVSLFSTPGRETTVYVIGPDIYTTAYGEGGGTLRVSVPQGIVLSAGDVVITPSLDSGVIGEISVVRSEATEPEQNGFVSQTALQSLHLVTVSTEAVQAVTFEEASAHVERMREAFIVDVPEGELVDIGTSTATSTEEE